MKLEASHLGHRHVAHDGVEGPVMQPIDGLGAIVEAVSTSQPREDSALLIASQDGGIIGRQQQSSVHAGVAMASWQARRCTGSMSRASSLVKLAWVTMTCVAKAAGDFPRGRSTSRLPRLSRSPASGMHGQAAPIAGSDRRCYAIASLPVKYEQRLITAPVFYC